MRLSTAICALTLASNGVFASSAMASALTIYPSTLGVSAISGNTSTGAPGFGAGSFQESGNTKGEVYVSSVALFGRQIRFSDIASVSYWTNKPGNAASVDWSFYIYTALTGTGDAGSFYHTRLVSEPLYNNTPAASVAANTWHQWASGGTNAMRFYDSARDGGIFGVNSDPTLATLEGGAYVWPSSSTSVDYRGELVNLFSLQTGSAWSAGFLGLVDGLTITLTNGVTGTVNLEAAPGVVPEPESIALLGVGLVGMLAAAARRKRTA